MLGSSNLLWASLWMFVALSWLTSPLLLPMTAQASSDEKCLEAIRKFEKDVEEGNTPGYAGEKLCLIKDLIKILKDKLELQSLRKYDETHLDIFLSNLKEKHASAASVSVETVVNQFLPEIAKDWWKDGPSFNDKLRQLKYTLGILGHTHSQTDIPKYTGESHQIFDTIGKGKVAESRKDDVNNPGYVGNY